MNDVAIAQERQLIGVLLYNWTARPTISVEIGYLDFSDSLCRWVFSWLEERIAELEEGLITEETVLPALCDRLSGLEEFSDGSPAMWLAGLVSEAPPSTDVDYLARSIVARARAHVH